MLFDESYLKSKKPVTALLMSPKIFFYFPVFFRKGMGFSPRLVSPEKQMVTSCIVIKAYETQIVGKTMR